MLQTDKAKILVGDTGGSQECESVDTLFAKSRAKTAMTKINVELERRQRQLDRETKKRGENDPYVIRLREIVTNLQGTLRSCILNLR